MASGSLLTKVDKAWRELGTLGLVEASPYRVFGAQATGCSPIATAFAAGHDVVQPVRPRTIAKSLAIGNPADGPYALDAVRRTGGSMAAVSDDAVVEGIRLLGAYRGGLRRDRRRRHRRHPAGAARLRRPRPRGRDRPAQHRRRAQDARRRRPAGHPDRHHPAVPGRLPRERCRVSVTIRVPTILRPFTGGAAEVSAEGATLVEVLKAADADHPGLAARVLDDDGQAAPVRQRLRRRRGRPLRAGPGDPDPGRVAGLDHPGGRGGLTGSRPSRQGERHLDLGRRPGRAGAGARGRRCAGSRSARTRPPPARWSSPPRGAARRARPPAPSRRPRPPAPRPARCRGRAGPRTPRTATRAPLVEEPTGHRLPGAVRPDRRAQVRGPALDAARQPLGPGVRRVGAGVGEPLDEGDGAVGERRQPEGPQPVGLAGAGPPDREVGRGFPHGHKSRADAGRGRPACVSCALVGSA